MRRLVFACTTALLFFSVVVSSGYFFPWRETTDSTSAAAQIATERDVVRHDLVPAQSPNRDDAISSDLAVGLSIGQQDVVRSEPAPNGSPGQNDAISSFRDVGQSASQEVAVRSELMPVQPFTLRDTVSSNLESGQPTSQQGAVRSELMPAQPFTLRDTVSSNLESGQPTSQQDIVNDTVNDLKLQGVPVVSAEIVSHAKFSPPLIVQYTLLRTIDNDPSSPGEGVSINLVHHAATFAQKRGLDVGGVGIVIVDSEGKLLTRIRTPVKKLYELSERFDPPFALSDADVSTLMDLSIGSELMSITDMQVSRTTAGLRLVTVVAQVPDIQVANAGLRDLMTTISQRIGYLNKNAGAQIAGCLVILTDSSGLPLLQYVNDIALGYVSWSQAKGLNNWGLPQPPPNATVSPTR